VNVALASVTNCTRCTGRKVEDTGNGLKHRAENSLADTTH